MCGRAREYFSSGTYELVLSLVRWNRNYSLCPCKDVLCEPPAHEQTLEMPGTSADLVALMRCSRASMHKTINATASDGWKKCW